MIWAVTPNPALDYTYKVPALQHGSTHRVRNVTVRPGGKGVNVARVADALGQPVTATGPLGGSSGERLSDLLWEIAPNVRQRWIRTGVPTRNSVAVVDKEATVFNEAGAPLDPSEWQELEVLLAIGVQEGDVVCFSGSFPPKTPEGTLTALVGSARKSGVTIIVDTSGPALLEGAAVADLVKPNAEELLKATGTKTVEEGVAALQDRGGALIALSHGPDGMELYGPDWSLSAKPPRTVDGNATGAGDASVAALAKFFSNQGDTGLSADQLAPALIDAVATSAAAVARPTAGEIDPALRLEFLDAITAKQHTR